MRESSSHRDSGHVCAPTVAMRRQLDVAHIERDANFVHPIRTHQRHEPARRPSVDPVEIRRVQP